MCYSERTLGKYDFFCKLQVALWIQIHCIRKDPDPEIRPSSDPDPGRFEEYAKNNIKNNS